MPTFYGIFCFSLDIFHSQKLALKLSVLLTNNNIKEIIPCLKLSKQ